MRKNMPILLSLIFAFFLCACAQALNDGTDETKNLIAETENTDAHASVPTVAGFPDEPEEETIPTVPLHSELFLSGCTLEQMITYFEEVVLNVEYSDGTGEDNIVKKWLSPIYYQIYGAATDTDKEILDALCEQLNGIPGFPGIYPAADASRENVSISFLEPAVFSESFSDVVNGEDAYGAAQFWYYTATNELHTARIGCRTDLDQRTRNSVLQEEIINILGLSDTILRRDSITYQYSNDNAVLSDTDLAILHLLYNPTVQCGDDIDRCRSIIQELYY